MPREGCRGEKDFVATEEKFTQMKHDGENENDVDK
jgi:hypothetical protein